MIASFIVVTPKPSHAAAPAVTGAAALLLPLDVRAQGVAVSPTSLMTDLLTAWGDSAEVRKAVEAWRKERGA